MTRSFSGYHRTLLDSRGTANRIFGTKSIFPITCKIDTKDSASDCRTIQPLISRPCARTAREATSDEVKGLRTEAQQLKELLAEVLLENRSLKKSVIGGGESDA